MSALAKSAALLLVAGATAVSAMAQNVPPTGLVTDYDLGRPCRFYLVRHLPAPKRCLVEFQGAWGPGSYTDGEFIFRDRAAWLLWRDREDYQHWRKQEFSWASPTTTPAAAPPVQAPVSPPAPPASAVLCPAEVAVKFVSSRPMILSETGWTLDDGEVTASLDARKPPHISGANLVCSYRLGSEKGEVVLYQSKGGRECQPRSDRSGFDCTR